MLKGDGLVTYLKRPSVELAVNILDGTPFRPGMVTMMKVQEARFELKGEYKRPTKPKKKPKKKVCIGDLYLAHISYLLDTKYVYELLGLIH